MNIGDKVRVLNGSEEGRIVQFKSNNIVEIEIEDGFTIPVMKNDLVVVSAAEAAYFESKPIKSFQDQTKEPKATVSPRIKDAFILSYIPLNENDLSVIFYNNSENKILFHISEKKATSTKTIGYGTLETSKSVFITYLKLDQFDVWSELLIQIISINTALAPYTGTQEYTIKPKAKTFFTSKGKLPGESKEGYMVALRKEAYITAQEIKESLLDSPRKEASTNIKASSKRGGSRSIDLHIESIRKDHLELKKEAILDIQKAFFEKELDRAIQDGIDSIKFIHGIGNGSLRHAIHKILSQAEHIRYFEDADKGKFGYGATTVHL